MSYHNFDTTPNIRN